LRRDAPTGGLATVKRSLRRNGEVSSIDPLAVRGQHFVTWEGNKDDPQAIALDLEQAGAPDQFTGCGEKGPTGGRVRQIFEVAFGFGIQAEGVNTVSESQLVVLPPSIQISLDPEGVIKGGGKGGGVLGFGVRVIDLVQVNDQQGGAGWGTPLIVVVVWARQSR
jgi:hypothetical protein